MAPHANDDVASATTKASEDSRGKLLRKPLKYGGSLDGYQNFEVTPLLGTEFPELQVADILENDEKMRDLAILASQRGVIFFRKQNLTAAQQKLLVQKMGDLTGKPATSKLNKHALYTKELANPIEETGEFDPEVVVLWSEPERKNYPHRYTTPKPLASGGWHADLAYETIPSDYSSLYLADVPKDGGGDGSGGDTLWASGYELYDRMSAPMKKMVDGLNAVHTRTKNFKKLAETLGFELNTDRGAPENSSTDLESSQDLTAYHVGTVHQLKVENHDLQVRFKWNEKDLAVWDNRATLHTATFDYEGNRRAHLVMSLGERPYYDPSSTSRRDAIDAEMKK